MVRRWASVLMLLSVPLFASTACAQGTPSEVEQAQTALVAQMDTAGFLVGKLVLMPAIGVDQRERGRRSIPDHVRAQIVDGLREKLRGRPGVDVVEQEALTKALADLTFKAENLSAGNRREAFMRFIKADAVCFVDGFSEPGQVKLNVQVHPKGGVASTSFEAAMVKSDALYSYLGEPGPGQLTLEFPSGARAMIDNVEVEGASTGSLSRRLEAGEHELSIHKNDYPAYARKFVIPSGGGVKIRVHEKSNVDAPMKSLTASAVLPGLGLLLYGRPKSTLPNTLTPEVIASTGAILFYTGAVMYGVDVTQRKDFLTKASRDRHTDIEHYELAGAAAGYVLNLVGGYLLGSEYARRNRQLISDARPTGAPSLAAGVVTSASGRPGLGVSLKF